MSHKMKINASKGQWTKVYIVRQDGLFIAFKEYVPHPYLGQFEKRSK